MVDWLSNSDEKAQAVIADELQLVDKDTSIWVSNEGYWFSDETGTDICGPYNNLDECRKDFDGYLKWLDNPEETPS